MYDVLIIIFLNQMLLGIFNDPVALLPAHQLFLNYLTKKKNKMIAFKQERDQANPKTPIIIYCLSIQIYNMKKTKWTRDSLFIPH